MHNGIKYSFIFTIGAAIGAFATWQYLKPKYEKMVQEEVNEFKKDWSGKDCDDSEPESEPEPKHEDHKLFTLEELEEKRGQLEEIRKSYDDIIEENKYAKVLEKGGFKGVKLEEPYVISPLKFAEGDEDYEVISLTYFSDGILVDDMGELIDDVESIVGNEFPEHFGEYTEDPDTVYVRNERLMVDYEIQRDLDTYAKPVDPTVDE